MTDDARCIVGRKPASAVVVQLVEIYRGLVAGIDPAEAWEPLCTDLRKILIQIGSFIALDGLSAGDALELEGVQLAFQGIGKRGALASLQELLQSHAGAGAECDSGSTRDAL